MVIFVTRFAADQGDLPASRRVFHAPLTWRKFGDDGRKSQMKRQRALARSARAFANWLQVPE
jgi:hypothetical protein